MRRLFAFLALAVLIAACGGPAQPGATPTIPSAPGVPTPDDAGGAVVISHAAWEYERVIYEPLARQFHDQNPNITVVIVPLDDLMMSGKGGEPESPTSALRRIVSGADTAPAFSVTPEALGTALLLDLKPLMDADATFQRDDFYPGALERWSSNGGVWALPRSFYVQTLGYNKDLFQAAGLPAPTPGWSWDDLLAAAEAIRVSGGPNIFGYFDAGSGMLPLIARLKAQGIDVLGADTTNIQLTDPAMAETVTQIRELYTRGVLVNPFGGREPADPQQLLREGRVGIWQDIGLYGPDGTPEQLPYPNGRVPFPSDSLMDSFFGGGAEGYIVSGGTASPEAAWKWVEFLSRQPLVHPQNPNPVIPNQVPARESLAEALRFWESMDEESQTAMRWTIERGTSPNARPPDYIVLSGLGQALSQVINDPAIDVRQALADAQRFVDEQRATQGQTPTPEPDTSPVIVATPEPQVAPEGATVIRYSTYGIAATELRRMARAFREQHPEIYVEIQNTDYITAPLQLADLAKTSDCFAWPQAIQNDADYAALLDLRPLMDADATFQRDDIPVAVLSAFERDGGIYGLPYAFSLRTLTYNRTLFDQAGIPLPGTTPWTLEEFLQTAQALSNGEGELRTYGYVPLGGPQMDMMFIAGQMGGQLAIGTGTDARPTYNQPETIAALRWYLDLASVHHVMPPLSIGYGRSTPGNDRSYEIITSGRGAMWFDYGKGGFGMPGGMPIKEPGIAMPIEPQPPAFEVGIAPLPVGKGGLGRGDMYVRGFQISRNAPNPQACWEFIKFLSMDVTQTYGDLPARTSLAQSEAYKAIAAPDRLEMLEIYRDVLRRPISNGADPMSLYSLDPYWLFRAISLAAEDKGDLATELDTAQKLTTSFMECVARGGTAPACALEVDPTYDGYNVENPEGVPLPAG